MIRQVNGVNAPLAPQSGAARQAGAPSFGTVLQTVLRQDGGVRLSNHAAERLRERNITLGESEMQRLGDAASRLAAKGGGNALVVMDRVGLILDVPNRTVVTAIDRTLMRENVFTNIDSAVFA
jgi:flagellar operon protein